jgi:hypothetical protein
MVAPTNLPMTVKNKTSDYFDNATLPKGIVNQGTWDALVGFFEDRNKGDVATAQVMATALINSAKIQNLNINEILDSLKRYQSFEVDTYLALILNSTRVPTSMLGVTNQPTTNKFVARTVKP